MAAKHRMSDFVEQRRPPAKPGVRRTVSGLGGACEVISASVLCAAAVALVTRVEPEKPSVVADQGPAPASEALHQEGTVIAVDDHVDIVGTMRGGTAPATAVRDRDAGHAGGPPMDFIPPGNA